MIPPHLKEAAEELEGRYIKSFDGVYKIIQVMNIHTQPNGGIEITVDFGHEMLALRIPASIHADSGQYIIGSPRLMTELEVVKWRMTQ